MAADAPDRFAALPDEVLLVILRLLMLQEKLRCGALSRRWRGVLAHAPHLFAELRFPPAAKGPSPQSLRHLVGRAGAALRVLDLRSSSGSVSACPAAALSPGDLRHALRGTPVEELHTLPSPKKLVFTVNVASDVAAGCAALRAGSLAVRLAGADAARFDCAALAHLNVEVCLNGFKPPTDAPDLLLTFLRTVAADERFCAHVRSLDLRYSRCDVAATGAVLAAALPRCTQLESLNVSLCYHVYGGNAGGGVALMTAVGEAPALRTLDVSYSPFGAAEAAALAASLATCTTLTKLTADNTNVGPDGGAALAEALARRGCSLVELSLCGCKLYADGVSAVARALPQNASLTRLGLARNTTGVAGADAVLAALARNTTLRRVFMQGNGLLVADVARCKRAAGSRVQW